MAVIRKLGELTLDRPPWATVREIIIPNTREVLYPRIPNRRRVTRVREDTRPQDGIEIRGFFLESLAPSGYKWVDFAAALMNQQQVRFDLGDGTEFVACDVLDVMPVRLTGVQRDPDQGGDNYAYVAKVLSYEPYTREKYPAMALATNGGEGLDVTTGNGLFETAFDIDYWGTAPGEPTWQITMRIPSTVDITSFTLRNTTTGERLNIPALSSGISVLNNFDNNRRGFILLMDAAGSDGAPTPRTPNNNLYDLLYMPSGGYGAAVSFGDGDSDDPPGTWGWVWVFADYIGKVPELAAAPGAIPPLPRTNHMTFQVEATGTLETCRINWLAPRRYMRVS